MESLLFLRIGVNFSPVERFLALKRWKMRFGQNVLRMAWKARFVQFLYKAYCFNVLAWISVRWSNFWLWNVEKCDLVKTSSAWPQKHVLYNFHTKPTVFTYWREFQSGGGIFGSKTLKNEIWPKRPPHCLKSTFCTIFMESLLFSRTGVNFSPVERFLIENVEKWDLAKTSSAMPEKHVLYSFHGKPTVFTYWREFQSGRAILGSKMLKNVIWPNRPPDRLKSTFSTILIQSLHFSRIGVNFSPVERFLDLKRWKMRFGQNVLRIAWKARFVQFSWKAYCSRIGVNFSPVERFFDLKRWKWDLATTSSKLPEKHVLYNFHGKPTVLTYWREFQSARASFGSETLRNAIWSKRPPHGLKSTFCTIFIQSLLFSRIGVNFSPLEQFLARKRWEMRFGQNVLRMASKARFVQFSYKAYSFHVLAWISVR